MMLDTFGVIEHNWRDALDPAAGAERPGAPPDFALSESPRYVGRAVAALARDPERSRWIRRRSRSDDSRPSTGSPTWTARGRMSGDTTEDSDGDRAGDYSDYR